MTDTEREMENETNEIVRFEQPTNDGWADAAADAAARVLRGSLLKFSDWRWTTGKEGVEVPKGYQLVAVATAHAWVKWQNSKPVEYRVREAGHPLPERHDLGDDDRSFWDLGPDGQRKDPWQETRFLYLVDPQTAEGFTFTTATWIGREAVMLLGDQIKRIRTRHPGAVPLIELGAAPHKTKFGLKSKPVLKVIAWRSVGDPPEPLQQIAPPTAAQEMNDEIPF